MAVSKTSNKILQKQAAEKITGKMCRQLVGFYSLCLKPFLRSIAHEQRWTDLAPNTEDCFLQIPDGKDPVNVLINLPFRTCHRDLVGAGTLSQDQQYSLPRCRCWRMAKTLLVSSRVCSLSSCKMWHSSTRRAKNSWEELRQVKQTNSNNHTESVTLVFEV